ncbi:MAG TPA: branched-chain amino acid ABC transporter permease [Acidimicrobiia bacterium]|nr:branched-chain amino acid ABC transporter permease [Acidimicrobiia bacterium]
MTTSNTALRRILALDAPTLAVDFFLFALKMFLLFVAVWAVAGTIALQVAGEGLPADAWRDVVVGGLAQGFMYGLIALGYSMVYGVLGFINFAHGEVFMAGGMTGYLVADALFDAGMWESAFLLAFGIVLLTAVVSSSVMAVLIERIAYRPLRGAPRLIPLITSIGMSFFIQYAVRGLVGESFQTFPQLPVGLQERVSILGVEIEGIKLFVICTAIVSMIGLWAFVNRSKTGRAIRAVSEDKEIAGLMGIDVNRVIVTTFAVGGAMAGVAGLLWAMLFRKVYFLTGFLPGIKAFTAAVLGGIGNLVGAMLGGVTLGLLEASGPTLIGGLRWQIPAWAGVAVSIIAVGGVVLGLRIVRRAEPGRLGAGLGYVLFGAVGLVLGLLVLPGSTVTIPGAAQLKDMIAFIVLIGVLMIRPIGLLGERLAVEERV